MPAPEAGNFTEHLVCWPMLGWDDHSQIVVSDVPEEHECDWQEGVNPSVDATVQIAANQDGRSPVGWSSKVWRGRLEDLRGTGFEDKPDGIMTVAKVDAVPDLKGREVAITLTLSRHKAALPTKQ